MAQLDILASMQQQGDPRNDALLVQAPSWLDKRTTKVSERSCGKKIDLFFFCPGCSPCKKKQMTVSVCAAANDNGKANKIAIALRDRHGCHVDTKEAPVKEQQLRNEVGQIKRKPAVAQSELRAADRKVAKAADAQAQVTEDKRQASRAALRRVGFDSSITEGFDPANKSTAMHAPDTGIIDSLKRWCQGSNAKLLQLVM